MDMGKMFRTNHEPMCAYCKSGQDIGKGQTVCTRHGVVDSGSYCIHFSYNPLRRRPVRIPSIARGYNASDFLLDDPEIPGEPQAAAFGEVKQSAETVRKAPDAAQTAPATEVSAPVEPVVVFTDPLSRFTPKKMELEYIGLEYDPDKAGEAPPKLIDAGEEAQQKHLFTDSQ